MAEYASFVAEYSNETGTGDITLDIGAVDGHRRLREVWTSGNAWVGYYLFDADGTNWERGYGRFSYSSNLFERDFVMESTNSDAAITLSSGTHTLKISPHPDMGTRRGYQTGPPADAGDLGTVDVADSTLVQIPFDTNPMDWDSESLFSAGTEDDFPIPEWVTRVRISILVVWPDNTTGNRLLHIKHKSGFTQSAPYPLPSSNIAGGTKITTNGADYGHHQLLVTQSIHNADSLGNGFRVYASQDSGGLLAILNTAGFCCCEFLE